MYVRKFEADTLDEALKEIKRELGPDAIILKTVTNKGFKGAFKKKKIEITAAISEKNYTQKAKTDFILNEEQKDQFYSAPADYVSNMIDRHSQHESERIVAKDYGKIALNKTVNSVSSLEKGTGKKASSGLDDFLNSKQAGRQAPAEAPAQAENARRAPAIQSKEMQSAQAYQTEQRAVNHAAEEEFGEQRHKIDELERKIFDLTREVSRFEKKEPTGVYELRTTLRSLDIGEEYIAKLIKKALFELSEDELKDADVVFEFSLREMCSVVNTAMPLFSTLGQDKGPVVTMLISETSSGQTSALQKIGALKTDAMIIRTGDDKQNGFMEKIFGMDTVYTKNISEIVSECRKASEKGKSVFIDYKAPESEVNETKKFVDGLRRAFENVEILVTVSAIHSELYNRKIISRYQGLANGMVISHLDLCLNYGALFNLAAAYPGTPLKFYGTGRTVPDDIEAATSERLMAGIFQLN